MQNGSNRLVQNTLLRGNTGGPAGDAVQGLGKRAKNSVLILFEVVDHTVGAGVKRVRSNGLAGLGIDGLDGADGGAGHIVHVEDGRVGVGAAGVERVRVAHADLGKLLKVAAVNGLLHGGHVVGHDALDALLEEARGGDGLLHARGGGDTLLGGTGDEDEGAHGGPVRGLGDEVGLGVAAVLLLTHAPGDVAAKQAAAGGARALAGDEGEIGGGVGELVEVGNGLDEGSEAGSGGGETSRGGEVVLGDNLKRHG